MAEGGLLQSLGERGARWRRGEPGWTWSNCMGEPGGLFGTTVALKFEAAVLLLRPKRLISPTTLDVFVLIVFFCLFVLCAFLSACVYRAQRRRCEE